MGGRVRRIARFVIMGKRGPEPPLSHDHELDIRPNNRQMRAATPRPGWPAQAAATLTSYIPRATSRPQDSRHPGYDGEITATVPARMPGPVARHPGRETDVDNSRTAPTSQHECTRRVPEQQRGSSDEEDLCLRGRDRGRVLRGPEPGVRLASRGRGVQ